LDVPVSVDSYKFEVVKQSLEAGADIINDIWGLKYDARLAKLAADYRRPIIITSNQRDNAVTGDIIEAIKTDLSRAIEICNNAGVPGENIIIDPGVGFGKTLDQNLEIIRRLAELKAFGKPLLLGTSRKGMLGAVLGLPAEDRLEGSAATNAIGIACGADIIRVHDVKFLARVAKMSDAVVRGKRK
jgi:dihydropteroate synthase